MLEWAFGKRITPAERLRKNQRMLDKAIRELDQQRVKLEKQEKALIAQIKQSAQKGQMGACKIQAKDLVRTRRSVHQTVSLQTTTAVLDGGSCFHANIAMLLQIRGEVLWHAKPAAKDLPATSGKKRTTATAYRMPPPVAQY